MCAYRVGGVGGGGRNNLPFVPVFCDFCLG